MTKPPRHAAAAVGGYVGDMIRYLVIVALLLSGCPIAEAQVAQQAPEGSSISGWQVSVMRANERGATDTESLTAAYNASGDDLFKRLAAAPGNIVLSPYSIGTAMAMLLSGARGDTETEMAAVLRHSLKRPEIADANAEVLAKLDAYEKAKPSAPGSARLKIANALMLTKAGSGTVAPSYVTLLNEKYAAEIFHNASVGDINAWVSQRTEGKITTLFNQIDPATAAVVLNAVYFKATWQSKFAKDATSDRDFNLSTSVNVKVPTMHQQGNFRLLAGSGFRAVELPFSVTSLSMVIVLPDAIDGATSLARRLDAAELVRALSSLQTTSVDLALPSFKANFKTSLVQALKDVGLTRPFDKALADFSGITGRPMSDAPMVIDQIMHSAVVEADEEGAEAAAATGGRSVTVSLRLPGESFTIDRPFLFYIVDDATGAILFQGLIADPRKT